MHSPARCPSGSRPSFADTSYRVVPGSKAAVFDAGTIAWACAIGNMCAHPITRRTEAVVRKVTDNLLRAFAAGPAGRTHHSIDNLAQLGIATNR
jgi:hypothetical protein